MRRILWSALLGVCLFTRLSFSGPPLGPQSRYERILCVVPMTGAGTYADPRRPMFAPAGNSSFVSSETATPTLGFSEPPRILGYHSVPSDDGQLAIVEFVARDRAAFQPILRASSTGSIQVFERGKISRHDLVQQLRRYRKNFTLESLQVGVQ